MQGLCSHVSFLSHKHPPTQSGNYESMVLPKVLKRLMVASVYTICADLEMLDLKLLIQMQCLLLFMYITFEIDYQGLIGIKILLFSSACTEKEVTLNLFLQQGSREETGAEEKASSHHLARLF